MDGACGVPCCEGGGRGRRHFRARYGTCVLPGILCLWAAATCGPENVGSPESG